MGSAKVKRVILIILDSVGVGHTPDADIYGDKGSNTIGNIVKNVNGFKRQQPICLNTAAVIPNLKKGLEYS